LQLALLAFPASLLAGCLASRLLRCLFLPPLSTGTITNIFRRERDDVSAVSERVGVIALRPALSPRDTADAAEIAAMCDAMPSSS
jgi:hypothetical protein